MNINDGMLIYFAFNGYIISDQKAKASDATILYNGFVNRQGGYYILEEKTTDGSFRYFRGNSGYTTAWAARETNVYDYFYNIFN